MTPAGIKDAAQRGAQVITADPNRSKSYARGATALGVALGLGELAEHQVTKQVIANDLDQFSEVASTSAGGELSSCEVLLFANSPLATGDYRIGHSLLREAMDVACVSSALRSAGLVLIASQTLNSGPESPPSSQKQRLLVTATSPGADDHAFRRGYQLRTTCTGGRGRRHRERDRRSGDLCLWRQRAPGTTRTGAHRGHCPVRCRFWRSEV